MDGDAELVDQVREVMASTFGVDELDLPDDVAQETFSRWTSLYQMTLLLALEDQFGVTFEMDEMLGMTSLPRIVTVLLRHNVGAGR